MLLVPNSCQIVHICTLDHGAHFFFFLMLEPPSNSGRQTGDTEKVLTEGPQILGVAFVKPALGTTVTAFCIFVVRFWKIWTYYRRRVCVCVYVSKCNNRFF